jgi:hypothetical protein
MAVRLLLLIRSEIDNIMVVRVNLGQVLQLAKSRARKVTEQVVSRVNVLDMRDVIYSSTLIPYSYITL